MKKDGSELSKLATGVGTYVLTEKEVYYNAVEGTEINIWIMNLDGSNKRKIIGENYAMVGIDNGWIYFYNDDDENYAERDKIYRLKLDGNGEKILFDSELTVADNFVVENEEVYFTRHGDKESSLIKKSNGEKETVYFSCPELYEGSIPVNKEGDWLYFASGTRLYKINANGKSEKKLVYQAAEPISKILLYDGDILITLADSGIYIKKNGSAIKLKVH